MANETANYLQARNTNPLTEREQIISLNDQFQINNNAYKKRTFTVVEVGTDENPNRFNYKCVDERGNEQFFSQTNLNFYGDSIRVI